MTLALHKPLAIENAIARAERFLLAAQDANGGWRDFLLPAGLSDGWVTAYAGEALLGGGGDRHRAAARRAWAFLHDQEAPTGGWSYNANVPGDADSTLWGLRLAGALGEADSPLARRGFAFLDRHVRPDGGLATYADAAPIRAYVGLPGFVPFDGWTQSHVCVSAAGAHLDRYAGGLAAYLLARQRADGSWPGYFWFDSEYATGEAVRALARRGAAAQPAVDRGTTWLIGRVAALVASQGPRSPAFALACAAHALAERAEVSQARIAARRAGAALAAWQRPNGSWGPSARLRVPPPYAIEPDENAVWRRWEGLAAIAAPQGTRAATFTNFSPDHRGIFGAATALRALRAVADC